MTAWYSQVDLHKHLVVEIHGNRFLDDKGPFFFQYHKAIALCQRGNYSAIMRIYHDLMDASTSPNPRSAAGAAPQLDFHSLANSSMLLWSLSLSCSKPAVAEEWRRMKLACCSVRKPLHLIDARLLGDGVCV